MSIFSKPVTAVDFTDLNELLDERAVENLRLEFKREIPTKDETLKKLTSFANTMGGLVVIGADAGSGDGRIVGLPGVDPKSGYKQTVVQWCFDGASPPLEVDVSDAIVLPSASGRVCYVLGVRESELAPDFLNGRKGVYVRTNEFSARYDAQLAHENELRHLAQRREIVRERRLALVRWSRERFDTFVNQKYGELGKRSGGIGARFDLSIGPRFPAQPLCEHYRLLSILPAKRISWRQVGFPRSTGGGFISQHESILSLRPGSHFSMLEANTWGVLFYASEIELEPPQQAKVMQGIHSYHFVGQLLVFLEHARVVLGELGYVGPLTVEMRLEAIRGVPWITFEDRMAFTGPASQLDDVVTFSVDATADDLANRRDALAMNILRYVFYASNLTDAVSVSSLEAYVRNGYDYNMWGTPTSLRV
jgi:Putative DNA-binding domain